MAGFPGLLKVSDSDTRACLQALFTQVQDLKTRLATLETTALTNTGVVNVNNQRITGLADPTVGSDAVSKNYLIQTVQAQIKGL